MREIALEAASGKSRILVGHDVPAFDTLCSGQKPVVVTTAALADIYKARLAGHDVVTVPDGEGAKSIETLAALYREFCARKLEKDAFIVSFGGGVMSDLTGFAASTYARGLHFGAVASTLLAQVDASVGGKNGINFGGFKNLIGNIRQAEFCLCDTSLLQTLPKRELYCGFAEVIKHAAIDNATLFDLLERERDKALGLDPKIIDDVVFESVAVKARIVQGDETEQGERRRLNFGHTLGHAIEAKYKLAHGEAVAVGMVLAGKISVKRGLLKDSELARLTKLIEQYHLPTSCEFKLDDLMEGIERDKKRQGDGIRMVLLEGIGKSRVEKVTFHEIREALR